MRVKTGVGVGVRIAMVVEWFVSSHGKSTKSFFWCSVEFQNLPGTGQENSVGTLVVDGRRIKQNRGICIPVSPGVCQELIQACGKPVQLSEIERPKIQKEIPIDELLVNVETNDGKFLVWICRVEKWIPYQNLVVLQTFFQSTIIESVGNNLNRTSKRIPARGRHFWNRHIVVLSDPRVLSRLDFFLRFVLF